MVDKTFQDQSSVSNEQSLSNNQTPILPNLDKVSTFMMIAWRKQGSFDEIGIYIMYEQVLSTWLNWLEQNINTNRTSIFFSSMSPTHVRY